MARPRDPLPRLNLNAAMGMQQQAPMPYSPALPTAIQQSFPPSFPMNNPLQTPMQPFFTQPPIPYHGRPTHNQGQASIAGLAAAGIRPPNGFPPMTPVGGHGHFSRPSLMGIPGAPGGHPFPNRNRRQPSIGGPPKAVLGGPTRKVTPLPPALNPPAPPPPKAKKVNVNLPKETIPGEEGESSRREPWARDVSDGFVFRDQEIPPVDISTADVYPSDQERLDLPNSIDVFLPGKRAWQELKQQAIEEKLEKLGVEKGTGSNVPHIHAPHARAASISSPADPQILLYKLNKLHASQDNSPVASLASSPNLALGGPSPRFLQNRHGQTMSLALPMLNPSAPAFDPFGQASAEHSTEDGVGLQESLRAIGSRSGGLSPGLLPPQQTSRPTSRPDFTRGFGLDIPEEAEEEEEEDIQAPVSEPAQLDEEPLQRDPFNSHFHERKTSQESRAVDDIGVDYDRTHSERDRMSISQSRVHSRHVSRLSAALSTRSAGALDDEEFVGEEDVIDSQNFNNPVEDEQGEVEERETDLVAEWTGTEDVYESSDDDESIGEYSNPSDEERVRQARVERRLRRRQIDQPRRLPLFPRPPDIIGLSSHQEDDIISNPSDEERENLSRPFNFGTEEFVRPNSGFGHLGHSLPALHHSRGASGQHSAYDPAHAHSRESSQFMYPTTQDMSHQPQSSISSSTRREAALNPFAKPFVFGAARNNSWGPATASPEPQAQAQATPTPLSSGHVRVPSSGKSLNAAAPEFKPGGFSFNFTLPPGVPTMPPAPPELTPESPVMESSPLRVQGREKRQKLDSADFDEEGDSMTSFRFPPAPAQQKEDAPEPVRRSHAPTNSKGHRLNPSAEPFKFPGLPSGIALPAQPEVFDTAKEVIQSPVESEPMELDEEDDADKENRMLASPEPLESSHHDEATLKAANGHADADPFLVSVKPKRAPIPLDFKHPVSTNTVPAGLFKALVNNGDGPARRSTIHSRMTSREIFEHNREPSMDDANVASISNVTSRSRSRLVTDPGNRRASPSDDVFGGNMGHSRRRSSFTDAIRPIRPLSRSDGQTNSASSTASLTGRLELQLTERRIENMLEERFTALSRNLHQDASERHSSTQAILAEIQSMFRTQLRDSVARSLEDSQLDARGDFDIQLFKDIVENANSELIKYFGEEVQALQQQVWESKTAADHSMDASSAMEEMANRTISAIVEAISELTARQEAINYNVPAREDNALVDKLMAALTPVVDSIRTEPVDYEFLTSQLTQSVKPHISQLIDLASDKRETAGLIVERIIPLLPSANFDIDAVTHKLTAEIRRAIAPIDAFEIKEQVADLVVERLDARLSVRDKTFNVDTIVNKVSENMTQAFETLRDLPATVENMSTKVTSASEQGTKLATAQEQVIQLITDLPGKLNGELQSLEAIQSKQDSILAELQRQATAEVPEEEATPDLVTPALLGLTAAQKDLATQTSSLRSQNDLVLEKLSALPGSVEAALAGFRASQAEIFDSFSASRREMDELKKANSDLQIQVNKARGAHGQIRVEKDVLQDKLVSMEADRDRLRAQLKEAQSSNTERASQTSALETKNKELEDALAKALARLQAADTAADTSRERVAQLEKANSELSSEKQALKAKAESIQLEVSFANKDRDSASRQLSALQAQHEQLQSEQSQWDDLRRASEKLDLLTTMVSQLDNEELEELRRYRDRTKVLEGEHSALQRRFKDQEAKLSNNERAAFTARQSLSQAQQRASEWEKRAKEYEGKVELLQTKLDHAEQTHNQLEADHSLVKLQLEEREANDRLTADQQTKMQNTITGLEAKVAYLQSELEAAREVKVAPTTNGHAPPRPDSRASTVFGDRATTPVGRINTPPQASVWDSMHAPSPLSNGTATSKAVKKPKVPAPLNRYLSQPSYPAPTPLTHAAVKARDYRQHQQQQPHRVASPAMSVVSAAPTQGEDGWWS